MQVEIIVSDNADMNPYFKVDAHNLGDALQKVYRRALSAPVYGQITEKLSKECYDIIGFRSKNGDGYMELWEFGEFGMPKPDLSSMCGEFHNEH